MKNIALTLREVADQANKEAEEKKMALHQEFIKATVIPYLQQMANEGKYVIDFTVPGYNHIIVRDLLRNLGFTAETFKSNSGHRIVVRW